MEHTPKKSQHKQLTLEKKILQPPLQPRIELATFPITCPAFYHLSQTVPTARGVVGQNTCNIALPVLRTAVPAGSPSLRWGVAVYVFDINQPSLPTPFFFLFSCLIFVFMALPTVFRPINFPENSPLSHSVLLVVILSYWSFQLHISL